ncbi:MAG TPA: TonB-dependent receptor [Povalibacter sp.]|uniref:TonB-dependent receptor n=1 Tax=Povalibacter sp. TaxID=1962978 RepID=UPI002C4507AE|nr:TonB-dependent receptor [Povalibacter sp.]HMN46106.1 TonB-dependent receptor [Povalibacter sp.]
MSKKITGVSTRHSTAVTGALLLMAAEASQAQSASADAEAATDRQEIERVEVIGERTRVRTELSETQEIPLSISIVGGEELDRLQARDIKSLVQRLSNVSWSAGNSRTSAISMRGIGKQAQTDAMDPSVGVVVDNVPYAYNPLATFGFFDVEAIEVTRGPQGTLSGKNANVGLINVTTKRPTFEPTAEWQVSLGQNSRITGTVAAGGPLIDGLLAWRASANVDKGDGDYPNSYNPDHTFLNQDSAEGRLQFLLTPTDNFEGRFIVDIKPQRSEFYNGWNFYRERPDFYANGSPVTSLGVEDRLARRWFAQVEDYSYERDYLGNTVDLDAQRPLVTKSRGASAEFNWQVGSYLLTSITAWRDYAFRAGNDEGTTFDVTKNGGGYSHNEQTSQEFRVSNSLGGVFDYTVGMYFLEQETNYISGGDDHGADAGAWFANNARYNLLDRDAAGRYLLLNSVWGLQTRTGQEIKNSTSAAFSQAKWRVTDSFTLTTGARFTREDRTNGVWRGNTKEGYAPELNPVAVNGVKLGGFDSDATTGVLGTNTPEQLALADFTANKYFGVASYAALNDTQRRQIAAAKATRAGRIGVVWEGTQVGTFDDTQPSYLVSPSYRFTDNITGYASYQYGEKAGIALVTNGIATPARPEKNTSYELGVKTLWLDGSLVLNAALFLTDIKDYQQAVLIFDEYTTNSANDGNFYYTQQTGNAEKVRAKGVEIDAFYTGIPHTSIRFSGAYNDAYYVKFPNAPQPVENTWPGAASYRDAAGLQLPGASKYSANIGVDFQYPVSIRGLDDADLHVSLNTAYISEFNSDVALSSYSWIPGYSTTDLSVGLRWGNYDLSVLGKNVLGDDTPLVRTWESAVPPVSRWFGVSLSGRL